MKKLAAVAVLGLGLGLGLALVGCTIGPNTRVNSYTPFGQFQPGESDRVSREYTASLGTPPPKWDVTILNSSLPPGMAMMNGHLMVADGAPYEVLGQFELGFRMDNSAPTQSELLAYLRRFAKAAHADLLVIEIQQRHDKPDKVAFVGGFAMHTKAGTKPAPLVDATGSTQL